MEATLEEKVEFLEDKYYSLETLLGRFIVEVNVAIKRMEKDTRELKKEMKDFKDEMKEFKDEMKDFKDEMKDFKDEMLEYKEWTKRNLEDSKNQIKEMNKQWGALANKLGTVVEDIIFPAARPVLSNFFKCEIYDIMCNRKCYNKKLKIKEEFDVIAFSDEYIFLIEVKTSPRESHVDEFINKKIKNFLKLFPEYKNRKIIPIFAALRFEDDFVKYLSSKNVYAMAYKEWEYMTILNYEEIKK